MNRRHLLRLMGTSAFAVSSAAALGAGPALACGAPPYLTRNIRFAPGSNSVELRDELNLGLYGQGHRWILAGKPEEAMTLRLDSEHARFALRLDEGDGKMPRWAAVTGDARQLRAWQGRLPASGRVMIELTAPRESEMAPYVLKVARADAAEGKDDRS
jgi:hypothetical protein